MHRAHGRTQPNEADEEIIIKTNDIPIETIVKLPQRPAWADLFCFQRMIKSLALEKMGLNVQMLHDPDNRQASEFLRQIHTAFYAHLSMSDFMDCWTTDPRGVIDIHLPSGGEENQATDPRADTRIQVQNRFWAGRKRYREE